MKRMVDRFTECGFTYFDTAYTYHDFQSEVVLRKALVERYDRDRFTIATKVPSMILNVSADLQRTFDEQLQKLGVEYIDYYMMHNICATFYPIVEELDGFGFISEKKAEGKIRRIGFSFHDNADMLDRVLEEHPEVDFVQLRLNCLDWDNESIQSRKCYEVAGKHGKEIIVMEPVKGGVLAKVPKTVEMLFKEAEPDMSVTS